MWTRVDIFEGGGGDLIQMEVTAVELRNLGIEVKISTDINEDLSSYDLVHVVQMDWTPETYFYAKKAKQAQKPLVLSPIHHSVKEVKRFDDEYAFGLRKLISTFFREQHIRDTWKNIYKSFRHPKKLKPTILSIFIGLRKMHIKTLGMADYVLVQTEAEARDLIATYGVNINWKKVPNGVGKQFTKTQEYVNNLGTSDYILCVGRIEARKNQLNIIKAVSEFKKMAEVNVGLVFAGKKSPHHGEFVSEFERELANNDWITYVPYTPWEDMPSLYHFAKVLVSASWFETSGLTILEALFSGANAVAAGKRTKEILGDLVSYCDPGDQNSIMEAIRDQFDSERPVIPAKMKNEYTWQNVARKTLAIYEEVLKK